MVGLVGGWLYVCGCLCFRMWLYIYACGHQCESVCVGSCISACELAVREGGKGETQIGMAF